MNKITFEQALRNRIERESIWIKRIYEISKREEIMDEKTVLALKDSIAHWERMITWASKRVTYLSKTFRSKIPDKRFMQDAIGETWSGNDCALCTLFFNDDCRECPLAKKYGNCGYDRENCYRDVADSTTWEKWWENAQIFLSQLKSLLPEEKPAGKLVIEVLTTAWGKIWRVKEQTYRNERFGNGKACFEASNGFVLSSFGSPSLNIGYAARVRGSQAGEDNNICRVSSEEWLANLRVAVKEYNECQRKLVGKSEICLNISNDTETIQ